MNYLLDSDAISALIKPAEPAYFDILSFLSQASNSALKLSILTIYEFEFNIARRPEEEKAGLRSLLNQTFDAFEEIPLGRKDAQIYGELKSGFLKEALIKSDEIYHEDKLFRFCVKMKLIAGLFGRFLRKTWTI